MTDKDAQRAAEVAAAAEKLKQLQDEADEVIERLERAIKYDMATDEEKAQLEAWELYSVLLSRVDTGAEGIEWPDKLE
ncbi:Caudovirales tail fiber assembly protein [compost metagenome]